LKPFKERIETILLWLIDTSLAWCQRSGKFLVHKSDMSMVHMSIKYLKTFFKVYEDENYKLPKEINDMLDNLCLYAIIWSIGAALEEKSRIHFSNFLTILITNNPEIP